jgi:acyl-CoA reductase-like NAD-dependent aldehyde dehydrogenase
VIVKGYMLIGGKRVYKKEEIEITFPYDGSPVGTIPRGDSRDAQLAVDSAEIGFEKLKSMTAYERFRALERAARIISKRSQEFAQLLTLEVGKTIKEAFG